MLSTIEQLEKEIEQFHNNVSAHNELYQLVSALPVEFRSEQAKYIEALKKLMASLDENYREFNQKCSIFLQEIEESGNRQSGTFTQQADRLSTETKNAISKIIQENSALVSSLNASIGRQTQSISETNARELSGMLENFKTVQTQYLDCLKATESALIESKNTLDEQYADFFQKLESINNLDQVYKICIEMKTSMNKNFILLFSGVGVAIALSIVSFFLR